MPGRAWLEALRGDLARRGLPAGYVERFLQELGDHIEDLFQEQEERMRTEAHGTVSELDSAVAVEQQLGGREELAEQAVAEYRRATFAGRHPVWTFVIAPLPAAVVAWVLYFLIAGLGVEGFAWALGGAEWGERPEAEWPRLAVWAVHSLLPLGHYVPPALVVLAWCWLARRSGRRWTWGLASCLLVALVAGLFVSQLTPKTATGKGSLMLGFGVGGLSWRQAAQFAAPLLVAAYYAVRAGRAARAARFQASYLDTAQR